MDYPRRPGTPRTSRTQSVVRTVAPVKLIEPIPTSRAMSLPPAIDYLPKVKKTIPNPTRNAEQIMKMGQGKTVETCYLC